MAVRLGWLAALAALALALTRLGRLLAADIDTRSWWPVLVAAAFVSFVVTASAMAAGARVWVVMPLNIVGAGLAVARVAAGSTMTFGIIPSAATPAALGDELGIALELIRFGSAPVVAAAGLVAVLAGVFWLLGAVIAYGSVRRRPLLMTIPALGFYLILATLDRRQPMSWWPIVMAASGALAFLAATDRATTGRARSVRSGRVIPARGRLLPLLTVTVVALAASGATRGFAATVPESGMVAWRTATGFGGGLFGGVSYNLFADMQQDLTGRSTEVVFAARVSANAPANSQLYWKLITLDAYDGDYWLPASLPVTRPENEQGWEAEDLQFRGPTVRVEQVVQIAALRQNFLPVLYSPRSLVTNDELLAASYRAREDGSVRFDARTKDGLVYRVISDVPQFDLPALASRGGDLSPLFQQAQEAGVFPVAPSPNPTQIPPTSVRETYTDLPDDFPDELQALARDITARTSTPFERAVLLEEFFRRDGGFVYDPFVSSGHATLDMVDWLTDPESRNYRTGYCEQFASAMALLARILGIPSRMVLGFAPGELGTQSDGSEVIIVRALHGHAWVELYMGGQGWIRFDPTPRSDGINPPTVNQVGFDPTRYVPAPTEIEPGLGSTLPGEFPDDFFLEQGADPTLGLPGSFGPSRQPWALPLFGALGLLALIPIVKVARRSERMRRLMAGDVGAGWAEMIDRLTDLGSPTDVSETPHEIAMRVDRALIPLATRLAADLYGGRSVGDGLSVYRQAEAALRLRYQGWRWWMSWLRPGSLWAGR
ncbi:MAG: transglutaminase TgpA family protein [Acidimicrobiia bacterium]